VDMHAARQRIFLGGFSVFTFDVYLAQTLADFAITDNAVNFADDRGILGLAGFEEFDNARQTAGDVLGLGGFPWNLGKNVAGLHIVAILDQKCAREGIRYFFLT